MWKCGSQKQALARATSLCWWNCYGIYTVFTCIHLLRGPGTTAIGISCHKNDVAVRFGKIGSHSLCFGVLCVSADIGPLACRVHRTMQTYCFVRRLVCARSSACCCSVVVDRLNNGGIISLESRLVMRCGIASKQPSNCVFSAETNANNSQWIVSMAYVVVVVDDSLDALCCYITYYVTQSRQQTNTVFMCVCVCFCERLSECG